MESVKKIFREFFIKIMMLMDLIFDKNFIYEYMNIPVIPDSHLTYIHTLA